MSDFDEKQEKLAQALGLEWKEISIRQWFPKDGVPEFPVEQPQLINTKE